MLAPRNFTGSAPMAQSSDVSVVADHGHADFVVPSETFTARATQCTGLLKYSPLVQLNAPVLSLTFVI